MGNVTSCDAVETGTDFSKKELKALRTSWNCAQSPKLGEQIWTKLLDENENFRRYFESRKCQHQDVDKKLVWFLERLICALESTSQTVCRDLACRFGTSHYGKGVNFTADNWMAMKNAIMTTVLDAQTPTRNSAIYQRVWFKFTAIIAREMKRGFFCAALGHSTDNRTVFEETFRPVSHSTVSVP